MRYTILSVKSKQWQIIFTYHLFLENLIITCSFLSITRKTANLPYFSLVVAPSSGVFDNISKYSYPCNDNIEITCSERLLYHLLRYFLFLSIFDLSSVRDSCTYIAIFFYQNNPLTHIEQNFLSGLHTTCYPKLRL